MGVVLVTCIVGIAQGGRVLVSADSAITLGDADETTTPDPKVMLIGTWAVGICGDWDAVVAAGTVDGSDIDSIAALNDALREAMTAAGVAGESWDAIAGRDGHLWALDGQSAPMRIDTRSIGSRRNRSTIATWAVGAGDHFARGALEAYDDAAITPIQRAEAVLKIASKNAPGVRPPWKHVEV